MKIIAKLLICVLGLSLITACNTNAKKREKYNRKIYLTEEDYLEDLDQEAAKERRAAQPVVESEYIFNAVPETDKAVYFFDERQQPKVPGQPSEADYKREKRLWEKPKRYSPDQYYGMQGQASTEQESNSSYESGSYEASYDY